jgi:cation transport ATPase
MSDNQAGGEGQNMAGRKHGIIAVFTLAAIAAHILFRFGLHADAIRFNLPLFAALLFGGIPLVWELLMKLFKRQFGSDLLAGISIVTSVILEEYLAGSLVVLMLSGGEALENYAVRHASSVLEALAKRMPSIAHLKRARLSSRNLPRGCRRR